MEVYFVHLYLQLMRFEVHGTGLYIYFKYSDSTQRIHLPNCSLYWLIGNMKGASRTTWYLSISHVPLCNNWQIFNSYPLLLSVNQSLTTLNWNFYMMRQIKQQYVLLHKEFYKLNVIIFINNIEIKTRYIPQNTHGSNFNYRRTNKTFFLGWFLMK